MVLMMIGKNKKKSKNKLSWIRDQKIMIKEFKEQEHLNFINNSDQMVILLIKKNGILIRICYKTRRWRLEFLEKMEDSLK